ncbi:hypothetical protein BJ508DRAFT_342121 [Ascobolus immersus RN42]|uniref:Uncharacterized protein n=1 Tax=Ascobolus immersus RN42 TaxID=1160509 RepID=A0A3N4HFB4_ASCIM|nr:hypothetical protein BJ508DRAFT_342121 [Ascobolus immersus RN42]
MAGTNTGNISYSVGVHPLQLSAKLYRDPNKRLPRGTHVGIPLEGFESGNRLRSAGLVPRLYYAPVPKVIFDIHQPVTLIKEDFYNGSLGSLLNHWKKANPVEYAKLRDNKENPFTEKRNSFSMSSTYSVRFQEIPLDETTNPNIIPLLRGQSTRQPAELVLKKPGENSHSKITKGKKPELSESGIHIVGYAAMPLTLGHHNVIIPGLVVKELFPKRLKPDILSTEEREKEQKIRKFAKSRNRYDAPKQEMLEDYVAEKARRTRKSEICMVIGADFLLNSPLGRYIYGHFDLPKVPRTSLFPRRLSSFKIRNEEPDESMPPRLTLTVTIGSNYESKTKPGNIAIFFAAESLFNVHTTYREIIPETGESMFEEVNRSLISTQRCQLAATILAIHKALELRTYHGIFFDTLQIKTKNGFVPDTITKEFDAWKKAQWMRQKKAGQQWQPVLDDDLWKAFDAICVKFAESLTVNVIKVEKKEPDARACSELLVEGLTPDSEAPVVPVETGDQPGRRTLVEITNKTLDDYLQRPRSVWINFKTVG